MFKLGFGNSPRPRFVYLNRQYPECLWYFWKSDKNTYEPILSESITGYLKRIEIKEGEHRGKEKIKLNLTIACEDQNFVLVIGAETETAKSLLNNLVACAIDFAQTPICIEPKAGDSENVLFTNVYVDGQLIYTGDRRLETLDAIGILTERLRQKSQLQPIEPPPKPVVPDPPRIDTSMLPISQVQRQELAALSKDMQWEKESVIAYLKSVGFDHSSQIPAGKFQSVCDGLRDRSVWENFHPAIAATDTLPLGSW